MSKEDSIVNQSKAENFWGFINERHEIYLKRIKHLSKPWSDDPIFQEHKFTNVFRELDPTTIGLRRVLRQLWKEYCDNLDRVLAKYDSLKLVKSLEKTVDIRDRMKQAYIRNQFITCILYRLFNWEGNAKAGPITNPTAWYYFLKGQFDNGQKIIGGNCSHSYQRDCTLESYIEVCRQMVSGADILIADIKMHNTLERAWDRFQKYDCIGPLIAYEFVCDLRYMDILRNAIDVNTWCYISPNAEHCLQRMGYNPTLDSIKRLLYFSISDLSYGTKNHWVYQHYDNRLGIKVKYPYWELSEIEHCLRQFDQYESIRLGQNHLVAKFDGVKK